MRSDLPSVVELCEIAGACQHTLQYAFMKIYSIGPKEYIHKTSLNRVRNDLFMTNQKTAKIHEIAKQHNYGYIGHFGSSHKKMFGELPSETLFK